MRKHHQVREGQIVRVIDGPLTGFRGEVKEVDEQTAKVAVQVFGRVTPMDLALGQIELVRCVSLRPRYFVYCLQPLAIGETHAVFLHRALDVL